MPHATPCEQQRGRHGRSPAMSAIVSRCLEPPKHEDFIIPTPAPWTTEDLHTPAAAACLQSHYLSSWLHCRWFAATLYIPRHHFQAKPVSTDNTSMLDFAGLPLHMCREALLHCLPGWQGLGARPVGMIRRSCSKRSLRPSPVEISTTSSVLNWIPQHIPKPNPYYFGPACSKRYTPINLDFLTGPLVQR